MNLRLNDLAELVKDDDGFFVRFGELQYGHDDLVPPAILGATLKDMVAFSASEFVVACMADQFGQIQTWPDEVLAFLAGRK